MRRKWIGCNTQLAALRMRSLLAALLSLAILCACTVQSGKTGNGEPVNGGTEAQQKALRAAARAVAARLDARQYDAAWELAGPTLSAMTTKEAFATYISALRAPLGAAGERTIKGFGFPTELEDAPPGQYGLIAVQTDFENAKAVEEKFVFEFVDGKWRLVGYFLSKKFTIGAATVPDNATKLRPRSLV